MMIHMIHHVVLYILYHTVCAYHRIMLVLSRSRDWTVFNRLSIFSTTTFNGDSLPFLCNVHLQSVFMLNVLLYVVAESVGIDSKLSEKSFNRLNIDRGW